VQEDFAIMSVQKRRWTSPQGEAKEAWVVRYTDRDGVKRLKTFDRRRDADDYQTTVKSGIRAGTHTADHKSPTVAAAGRLWLQSREAQGVERSTLDQYRQHLELHIAPLIGGVKLSQLTVPAVREFEDRLRIDRSPAMVKKALSSLGMILADAHERGLVAQNVARGLRARRRGADKRQKGKLKVGVDIPSPAEIRTLVASLGGRWRPLFLTAIFTGLRASELRGLRWSDVDLKRGELHVRQRVDRFGEVGALKSESAERIVPLPPLLASALREWRLACPKGPLGLVFPNGAVGPENMSNILQRGLQPAMIAAGLTEKGGAAKYTGMHALRHFFASWCINRRVDGGLELPLKIVQSRMGHSSIQMTADTYGHLFPRGDDGGELAAAERELLGT
jgi:integrase